MGIMDEWEKTILPMISVDVNDLFAQLKKAASGSARPSRRIIFSVVTNERSRR